MRILTLVWLLLISSCVEKKPGTSILTTNIFNQATFSINDQEASGKTIDLGEHLLTDPAIVATVQVFNGTDFPYTDIDLEFPPNGEQSSSTNFLTSPDGSVSFPGEGGTCKRTLAPKKSCTMVIEINPREGRVFNENIKLIYKQYVESEEHSATITFLAGMPASLIFTSDKDSIYNFGELTGPEKNPTVERADGITLTESLEIKNVGGLTAKDLTLTLDEFCTSLTSTESNFCPEGMKGAYRLEHNCPKELTPGELCQLTIFYRPLNQNPSTAVSEEYLYHIKEIAYDATFIANYITSSSGKTASLPAYFKSVSTDIEASFTTINKTLDFNEEIISGNRDKRTISFQNRGRRSGYLLSLSFHNANNLLMANCFPQEGSSALACLDPDNNLLSLSAFPFTIKDVHSCLSTEVNKKHINVSQSCGFEITFQPSVTFTQPKEFLGLKIYATWDALYKGQELIVKPSNHLSVLNAKSTSQAQVIVDRIQLGTTTYYVAGQGTPNLADFGRLALQSKNYGVAKSLQVIFKNIGKTRATNIQLRDGKNVVIPVGGSPISLGSHDPSHDPDYYYYKRVQGNSSTCNFINEGSSCTVSMNFLPVALNNTANETANMFDYFVGGEESGVGYKDFKLTYDSGVSYTDDNLDGDKNYPLQEVKGQITAKLIYKGILSELSDDTRNYSRFGSKGTGNDELFHHFYLRNIGTGPISYIQSLANPPGAAWSLVETPNFLSLGADHDCFNVVDQGLSRPLVKLAAEKSCVFTIRIKQPNSNRHMNIINCTNEATDEEDATRLFYKDLNDTPELWEICRSNLNSTWQNARYRYFDGDAIPGVSTDSELGYEYRTNAYGFEVNTANLTKLHFYNFSPPLTATAYRQSFKLPNLETGYTDHNAKTIPEAWFYGMAPRFWSDENASDSPFIKAGASRHFMKTLPSWSSRNNYEYVYYAGSFPKNSGKVTFTPTLMNGGGGSIMLHGYEETPLSGSKLVFKSNLGTLPMNYGSSIPLSYELDTDAVDTVAGEHALEAQVTFESGEWEGGVYYKKNEIQPPLPDKKLRTVKFLVLANVTSDHPKLDAKIIDYEMEFGPSGDLLPPVPQPEKTAGLSWNNTDPTQSCAGGKVCTLVFETVKIPGSPGPNDPYAKKTIRLKNTGTQELQDFSVVYRSSTTSSLVMNPSTNFTKVAAESDCGATLPASQSCNLVFQYRPNNNDTTQTVIMTLMYRSSKKEYFMQNIQVHLSPVSPGRLVAQEKSSKTIRYKVSPTSSTLTKTSYELAIPVANSQLSKLLTPINFADASGSLKRITLKNPEPTKTSLLLAYQKWITQNSILGGYSPANPAPSSLIPQSGVNADNGGYDNDNGVLYANIFQTKYSTAGNPYRLKVQASKGCFFGDDENNDAIPAHQKGFNATTTTPCELKIYFNASFEYLNKEIRSDDGDLMRDNAMELWYYTVNRSASTSIWFHLSGTIIPQYVSQSGSYGDVKAADNRVINFSTINFAVPSGSETGSIVGVRVYMSNLIGDLNNNTNLYKKPPLNYVDIRFTTDNKWVANFTSGLQNNRYYYFRAAAIRKHTNFLHTAERYVGLEAGEYISLASSTTTLKVLVPPPDHYYIHNKKVVVNKRLQLDLGGYSWLESFNTCKKLSQDFYDGAQTKPKNYQLMNMDIWREIIKPQHSAAHLYYHENVPHWVNEPMVDLYEELEEIREPAQDTELWEDLKIYYLKDSPPTNPLQIIVGGVPLADYTGFISYVPREIELGNVRCVLYVD